ncbi:hypothetical protein N6H18_05675 [Reichenbachiella agarivorans]|uniref:Outer membrane protein assembly factor BamA n=1 Tax=Reichenbachiella agarivorans TaxID=2979464 RepID=A0ABY6CSE8_9BACT|nr:hypothetical protein [Reichenbachiella agarivorans]UXP33440.1 hypothetical protein N6H18_05675 [Reichenbachiella agarivorans]
MVIDLPGQILKEQAHVNHDSIKVKADRFLFLGDEVYYIRRDTTIAISDTTDYYVRKHTLGKSDAFYDSVEQKMSRSRVSSMVYDVLFTKESKSHGEGLSEFRFTPYEDRTINPLKYKHLAVFGSSMNDTSRYRVDPYTNVINKLHVHTQRWVVRRTLTFREGDFVDAQKIVDSERLLRSKDFIRDARIMVLPSGSHDSVETHVVTRDIFPYAVSIQPNNDNNALVGISSVNIGGLGHELEYNYIRHGGSELFYTINNLFASYIDIKFDLSDHFRKRGLGIEANRSFFTQDTKYAGGIELSDYKYGEFNYDPDVDSTSLFYYSVDRSDLWLGRSFPIKADLNRLGFKNDINIVVAGRLDRQNFYDKPLVTPDSNYIYHSKTNYLVEVGLSSRNYFKDRYVLNYGRTEDIPTGSSMGVTTGFQHREFVDRYYLGFKYALGGYFSKVGYLNIQASYGAFYNEDHWEDGTVRINTNYYTSLLRIGNYRFRQFAYLTLLHSIRPTDDHYIRGSNQLGIYGVSGYYLKATSLLNAQLESLFFSPYNVMNMRLAFFGFVEGTLVKDTKSDYFDTDFYSGVGLGVSISNDKFAISTLTIRLAYYPHLPLNATSNFISASTSSKLKLPDFDIEAPEVVGFTK